MTRDPRSLADTAAEHDHGWGLTIRDAMTTCAERRRRVLSHPDLAQQLTQPPLSWTSPGKWNGYVPSKWSHGRGDGDHVALNDSPYRAALVAILDAVAQRDGQAMP